MQGYVQVYTGDGKGKTTAALGLILRAVGAGRRVYMGQFLKAGAFSEIKILQARFPEVTVEQFGAGRFIRTQPTPEDLAAARDGLERVRRAMLQGAFDVVVADEANTAVNINVLTTADLLGLIDARPPTVELVLTGRGARPEIIARADLATEMRCLKHYYDAGVQGRPGIES